MERRSIHTVDLDARISLVAGELGLEDRRPCREHAPVCTERLVADLERHVGAVLGAKEAGEVDAQVGLRHIEERLLHAEAQVAHDIDVAPDGEAVVLQVRRALQVESLDENVHPATETFVSRCCW